MPFDVHSNGKSSFHSHLMKISEYFNLPDFNPNNININIKLYLYSNFRVANKLMSSNLLDMQ